MTLLRAIMTPLTLFLRGNFNRAKIPPGIGTVGPWVIGVTSGTEVQPVDPKGLQFPFQWLTQEVWAKVVG